MCLRPIAAALFVGLVASHLWAAAPEERKPGADPGPLTAKLIAKKTEYPLDPAQAGQAFRDRLKAAMGKGQLPEPPAVDLVLEIKNGGAEPVTILIGADNGRVGLALTGPGAVSIVARRIFTKEFRIGKPVMLAPGATHAIPITALKFGFRGVESHAYWTEPGEYQLTATLVAPDAARRGEGQKHYTVTTPAIMLKVVAAE